MLLSLKGVGQTIYNYNGTSQAPGYSTPCFGGILSFQFTGTGSYNSALPPKNVGDYTLTVGSTACPADFTSVNYSITPVILTITANNANKVYGTTLGTHTGSTDFIPTGLQNGETIGSVTLSCGVGAIAGNAVVGSTSVITPSAPVGGTFTASNYTINYATGTLTVVPATITITVNANQEKIYGAADPSSYAYTLSTPLIGSDILTGALIRVAGESVDSYAISQGTLSNTNYIITFIGNNFTITKKPLTITATADQTKIYGTADPSSYAYTLSTPLIGSDALSGALTRVAGETVGQYIISQGTLTNANYDITYVGSDFSITKAALTITALPKIKVYGETNPTLTFAYTGLVNTDAAPSTLPTISTTALASSPVGSYPISISGASDANYTISYIDGILKIEKKEINVIADSQLKDYNTTDPPLTYTFSPSPLIGSDNFTGALIRSIGEAPGPYEINQGTLSLSSNYQLNFTKGILTIKPETIFFFEIPNAFVPGSSNDLDNKFRVFYNSAFRPELFKSLSIYNRNGQFIKRFDSITDSWDGRIDFVLQEADVYLWTVAFNPTINDNEKINISKIPKSGTFILLK